MPPKLQVEPTDIDTLEQLRFMQASLEHLSDLVVVTDARMEHEPQIVYVNQAVVSRTGYQRHELLGRNPRLFQGRDTDRKTVSRIAAALRVCEPVREELLNYTRDNTPYWIDITIVPLRGAGGEVTHFVSTQSDITARKQIEQDLILFRQAIDQSPSSVIITDRLGKITYVNRGFEINSGYSGEEVYGRTPGFRAWKPKSDVDRKAFWDHLYSGQPWHGEFVNRHKDGRKVIKRAMVSPVRKENGEISHFLSVEQDVTAEKKALEQLEFLAYHDTVTGLPNRRLLEKRGAELLNPSVQPAVSYALVLVDLDDFKRINDAYGLGFGDQVLKVVARRVESCVWNADEQAAHLGGDEFSLLWRVKADDDGSELKARLGALQDILAGPVLIERQTLSLTASMGVAWVGMEADHFTAVQRNADLALYRAKQNGKGGYAFFKPELDAAARRRVSLEEALRIAILRDELSIAIQSQYSPSGQVKGGEVLVRWLDGPDRMPVPPAEFIPVAETSGLIKPLTLLVLSKALAVVTELLDAGIRLPLSVNFSTDLFRDVTLIDGVLALVAESGLPPELLVLEITESLFIDTQADVLANMERLSAAGLKFSLDDFGTGYSNLAYLKRMHLSELKIDKSFVDHLPHDDDNRAIVRSILSIARQLKLRVVAEGVETAAQADFLSAHGCDLLQGYLLHKPAPAVEWVSSVKSLKNEKKV